MRLIERKDCPMRHENGNCTAAGGFCTAVNDPICEALHNAFNCGEYSEFERITLVMAEQNTKYAQETLETLRKIHEKVTDTNDPVHVAGGYYCWECKYITMNRTNPDGTKFGHCEMCNDYRHQDDFCSCGKRKDD